MNNIKPVYIIVLVIVGAIAIVRWKSDRNELNARRAVMHGVIPPGYSTQSVVEAMNRPLPVISPIPTPQGLPSSTATVDKVSPLPSSR